MENTTLGLVNNYRGVNLLKFSILGVVTGYWLPTSGAQIPQRLIFTTVYPSAEFRVKKQIASSVNDEGTNDLIVNVDNNK